MIKKSKATAADLRGPISHYKSASMRPDWENRLTYSVQYTSSVMQYINTGTCAYEGRVITDTNVRITVLWYILIQSKELMAGNAMIR